MHNLSLNIMMQIIKVNFSCNYLVCSYSISQITIFFFFRFTRFDGIGDDVITVCDCLVSDLEEAIKLNGTVAFLEKPKNKHNNKLDRSSRKK